MNKRSKQILIIIGVFFGGLIVFLIINALIPRSTVQLLIAPEQAFVSVDNGSKKSVKNTKSFSVSPGKHTLVFSRDEFDSYTEDIIVDNHQTIELVVALNPLTDAAKQLLLTDAAEEVVQRFDGKKMISETEQLNKAYPILSVLPIDARLYVVNSCKSVKYPDDTTKIALCIELYAEGLEPYIAKDVTSRGFNLTDYEVIYIDKFSPSQSD